MIDPKTLAGTLTIPQLNAYVKSETERLEDLGFSKDDIDVGIPVDHIEVGVAVMVPTIDRETGKKKSFFISSHVITGREPNGNPVYPRRTREMVKQEMAAMGASA